MADHNAGEIGAGRGDRAIDQFAILSRGPYFDAAIKGDDIRHTASLG